MFRLQNHLLNMNMTKFQVTYQEKDFVLTLGHLTILVYRFFFFFRKTWEELAKALNGTTSVL